MKSVETIHLAFCIDDGYSCHLAALLQSIKQHRAQVEHCCHIVSDSLSQTNKSRLLELNDEDFSLFFYQIKPESFAALPVSVRYQERLSVATYYRLALPELLDECISRVIYLDADMLCLGSLLPLWQSDMKGKSTAVVRDASLTAQQRWVELKLSMPHYFNAGLLLMDLTQWRKQELAQRTLAHLEEKIDWDYNDQDILNLELNNDVVLLEPHWNVQSYQFAHHCVPKEPVILHFTGAEKPWHSSSVHPFRQSYIAARKATAFADFELQHFLDAEDKATLASLKHKVKAGQSLLIYGAGQKGRRLYQFLKSQQPTVEVIGFVDNNVSGEYDGKPIYSGKPSCDFDWIVIASKAFEEEIRASINSWNLSAQAIV